MDREQLFAHFEQYYYPKRDILNRLPLGVPLEGFWQELLNRRRGRRVLLKLYAQSGEPCWYVVTEKMIAASERIIEELMTNEVSFDPYRVNGNVSTLEEVYYTSYVEGAIISIQDAMAFLQVDEEARDINEQMILNNRRASSFVTANLYKPVDEQYLRRLAYLLTERMDGGGDTYRSTDTHEIPSMKQESYTVPPAASIPGKMRELTLFLQDSSVHPLIKAGAAHAWILMVRPFEEGNERLARLLSTVILLRAGYSFFGEISLSAIIARQTYAYYSAMANILRQENGDDLTYFLEYFLELLVHALEERKIRNVQRHARELVAEQMMAAEPIGAAAQENAQSQRMAVQPEEVSDDPKHRPQHGLAMEALQQRGTVKRGDDMVIRQKLVEVRDAGHLMPPVADILEGFLDEGIFHFTRQELLGELGYTEKQVESVFVRLKEKEIIRAEFRNGNKMVYCFTHTRTEPDETQEYSKETLDMLRALSRSAISIKDKRIGSMLLKHLETGKISLDDYDERGWGTRWQSDMRLAWQLGLVERINNQEYRIRPVPEKDFDLLLPAQKTAAAAMYKEFGEAVFSLEMVMATLEYSSAHASSFLHLFTLLKILECRKEDVNWYHFLITPHQHPECFAA